MAQVQKFVWARGQLLGHQKVSVMILKLIYVTDMWTTSMSPIYFVAEGYLI